MLTVPSPVPPYEDRSRHPYDRCPLCDVTAISPIRDQDWSWRGDYDTRLAPSIRWMACNGCGHQFTWGYHTEPALRILFANAQAGQTAEGLTARQIEAARPVWAKVVDAVSLHRAGVEWLDVGAGAGMLLAVARECGYEVAAVEPRDQVAAALQAQGLPVLGSDVTDLGVGHAGRFDVISLCDVLEHVPYPRAMLETVERLLRPGGVLFVSCPNIDSLAWTALDSEDINPYWSEIEHYHNFSFRRLRELLSEYGFTAPTCSVSNRYQVCMDVLARKQ